jgi:hypothetical protein
MPSLRSAWRLCWRSRRRLAPGRQAPLKVLRQRPRRNVSTRKGLSCKGLQRQELKCRELNRRKLNGQVLNDQARRHLRRSCNGRFRKARWRARSAPGSRAFARTRNASTASVKSILRQRLQDSAPRSGMHRRRPASANNQPAILSRTGSRYFRNSVGFSLIGKCPRPFMMVASLPSMLRATDSVSSGVQE